ncbi:hypothetical protein BDL97_13G096700 [Sphagnum fallax]|nr:hypothetical protein BDL97_13G096700 [Sphagnum fallax]
MKAKSIQRPLLPATDSKKPIEPVKSTNQANTKRSFWL